MTNQPIQRTQRKYLNDFAAFILCHGRPENVPTYETLLKYGYTGKIYIICDDEDKELDNYKLVYGEENVQVFSKDEALKLFDTMDNTGDKRCAVYARNACYVIAKNLGLKYFCQLDDDYISLPYRYAEGDILYRSHKANLDDVFEAHIEFMETNPNIYSVAFAQAGDLIGGTGSRLVQTKYRRKCMNSWICKTDRVIQFNGTMNDDTNSFTLGGFRGQLFFTFPFVMVDQPETQQVEGGMTDMYLGSGTYQKSFYTVLQCPSFVKVGMMGDRHYRMHHQIDHTCAYPMIISDRYKKSK